MPILLRRKSVVENILYHGSPFKIEQLTPQPNIRLSTIVDWKDEAIFATPDYRIALHYTANKLERNTTISLGVDLRTPLHPNEPVTFILLGGTSRSHALEKLYGRLEDPESCKGYIYHLDGRYYNREVGLGANEKITRNSHSVLFRQEINRRQLIDDYVHLGKITINWIENNTVLNLKSARRL